MANTIVLANRKNMRNACIFGCFQGADKLAFRASTNYIGSSAASTLDVVAATTVAISGEITANGNITTSGVKRLILGAVASTGVTDGSVIRMGTSASPLTDDQAGAGFVVGYFDSGATSGWPAGAFFSTNVTGASGSFTALQGDAVLTAAKQVVTGVECYMQLSTGGRVTGSCRAVQGTVYFSNESKGTGGCYAGGCFSIKGGGSSCSLYASQRIACIELKNEGTYASGYDFEDLVKGYAIYINGFTAASGTGSILSSTSPSEFDLTSAALGLRVGVGADNGGGSAYYIPLIPAADWN